MKNELINIIVNSNFLDKPMLASFIEVESSGSGFDSDTKKIKIQFEPHWFKKLLPNAPSGKWSENIVDKQSKEWEAFNSAYKINRDIAMQSTSIGLGQIMGFHYKRLGYKSAGAMWDDAKKGLKNQVNQIIKFIETDKNLLDAVKAKDFTKIATIYNGAKFRELAKKENREPYDISMAKAYEKYKKEFANLPQVKDYMNSSYEKIRKVNDMLGIFLPFFYIDIKKNKK